MSRFKQLGLPAILMLLLSGFMARGASRASLFWDANPDPSVVGYNIYYGGVSGVYTNMVSVSSATNTVISGLTEGQTYYFVVTDYDSFGDESPFSNEVSYLVPGILTISGGGTSGAPIRLQFPVAPGQQCQLQTSDDMMSWHTLWQTTAVANAWLEFDDPHVHMLRRFYRLVFN